MIFDSLEHASFYAPLHPAFEKAFDFLRESIKHMPQPGRYELDGDRLYANVQTYTTHSPEEVKWEAHRKYIDIQFLLSGKERIGCANVEHMINPVEYSQENDVQLADDVESPSHLSLSGGDFAIFYPQDAHQPTCKDETAAIVVKIVVKVLI